MTIVDYECAIALLRESNKIKDEDLAKAQRRVAKLERLILRYYWQSMEWPPKSKSAIALQAEVRRIQKRKKGKS